MSGNLALLTQSPKTEIVVAPTIDQMPGESEQQYFWAVKYWELGKGCLPVYWISQAIEADQAGMREASGTFKWFERYRLYRAYMAEQRREILLTHTQEAVDLLVPVLAVARQRLGAADPNEAMVGNQATDWDLRAGTFTKLLGTLGQLAKATADNGVKVNVGVDNRNQTAIMTGGSQNPDAGPAGIAWGMPPTAKQREPVIIEGEYSEENLVSGNDHSTVE